MTAEKRTGIGDVRAVGVPVADQDRALEFYVGKLGFEKRLEVPLGGGQRWIEVPPPGATTTIAHADMRAVGVDAAEVLRTVEAC
jgi:catechol 2,3-dioxygenase-like lactoylglutathione lyase family enzyme